MKGFYRRDFLRAVVRRSSELLDAAAEMTAEGGTLVYAVCSLEPEEGEEQAEAFLRGRSDFAREPVKPEEVFDARFV